jgi:O-antigen ligase
MGSAVNADGRHPVRGTNGRTDAWDERHAAGTVASLREVVRRAGPMWLVAFSLNGFFVYLAVLDAIDVGPTTSLTGTYYGLVCAVLLATAWARRRIIVARLRPRRRTVVAFVAAATTLSMWFLLNTALLSEGAFAMRLAALMVLWTIPTALVAASLRRHELPAVAQGLVAFALLFVAIEVVAIARVGTDVFRFSPIADLDPISAGMVPAIGAIAVLSFRPLTARSLILQFLVASLLVAAAAVPGSRGPLVALVLGALALVLVQAWRRTALGVGALVLGLGLGFFAASHIGSFGYLTSTDPFEVSTRPKGEAEDLEISTLSIRRQWLEDAIRDTPDRPLFGHGVGMQVDDTPEAARMGVSGQHTYPHNTLVEAAYSLGAIGLIAYLVFVGSALLALVSVVRRGTRDPVVAFALAIGAFAFVNTNVSGEIGEDALLWTAAAIAVALYADLDKGGRSRSSYPAPP